MPDNRGTCTPLVANDAESFGEEFMASALAGESVNADAGDEVIDDEEGGPFLALDDDAQLPPDRNERTLGKDGHEPVERQHTVRGARWAARGF